MGARIVTVRVVGACGTADTLRRQPIAAIVQAVGFRIAFFWMTWIQAMFTLSWMTWQIDGKRLGIENNIVCVLESDTLAHNFQCHRSSILCIELS
jgi:hypothetical protein